MTFSLWRDRIVKLGSVQKHHRRDPLHHFISSASLLDISWLVSYTPENTAAYPNRQISDFLIFCLTTDAGFYRLFNKENNSVFLAKRGRKC